LGYTIIAFDEVSFYLAPVYRRAWHLKGTKPTAPFFWSTKKVKLFGALINGNKIFYKYYDSHNSTNYRVFLFDLIQTLDASKKYVFLLDNASYHKSVKIREFMHDYGNIIIEYFPPYSPELNPIEICWKITRANVTNNVYYTKIEDMQSKINNFLDSHNFMLNLSNYLCR